MKLFSTSRYANVTATLALALAVGGTGYAASALPGSGSKPADKTAPAAVFQVSPTGHLLSQKHIAPATARPKVKKVFKGNYSITFQGFKFFSGIDVATCSAVNYQPTTILVDGAGNATMIIHTFDAAGNAANIGFDCSVWNMDGK